MGGKPSSAKTTHVSVRLDNDVLAEIDREMAVQHYPTTRNAIINKVLREWFIDRKKKGGGK